MGLSNHALIRWWAQSWLPLACWGKLVTASSWATNIHTLTSTFPSLPSVSTEFQTSCHPCSLLCSHIFHSLILSYEHLGLNITTSTPGTISSMGMLSPQSQWPQQQPPGHQQQLPWASGLNRPTLSEWPSKSNHNHGELSWINHSDCQHHCSTGLW